jgi:hypothetical protein
MLNRMRNTAVVLAARTVTAIKTRLPRRKPTVAQVIKATMMEMAETWSGELEDLRSEVGDLRRDFETSTSPDDVAADLRELRREFEESPDASECADVDDMSTVSRALSELADKLHEAANALDEAHTSISV